VASFAVIGLKKCDASGVWAVFHPLRLAASSANVSHTPALHQYNEGVNLDVVAATLVFRLRYRKKILLIMGFALCFFGNERTPTTGRLLEASNMSVAAVGVFNIFSVHVISLCVAFLALVSVFVYIPFVSDFAFWFMLAAYIGLAGHR
jgi:hypothetical protein